MYEPAGKALFNENAVLSENKAEHMGLIEPVWIIAVAAMWTFYAMAAHESRKASGSRANEVLWPVFSIVVSVIVIRAIDGGVIVVLAGQFFVFIGVGVWRALRD